MGIDLTHRRLVIAHNPHSTGATAVQVAVFDRLKAAGYAYETIEVQQASLQDNIAHLAPLIQENDVILSAAGDGSAHAVFHTVLAANQPGVQLGFLGFGNFNDVPHTFTARSSFRDPVVFLEQAKPEEVWPISIYADGELLRSALLYITLGWTAQAAAQFDNPKVRGKLTKGGGGLLKSLWRLGWYYFKTRRDSLLPPLRYNGKAYQKTDLIFANGPSVARIMRSMGQYYRGRTFLFRMVDVRGLVKNMPFLMSGFIGRMKGDEVEKAAVEFDVPLHGLLQCDGEVVQVENVTHIEVKKAAHPLEILTTK